MTILVLFIANLLFPFAALGIVLRFALSPRRGVLRGLGPELSERFGRLPPDALAALAGRPVVWIHAASAGEVSAVAGLLRSLRGRPSPPALLVTTMTAAGLEKARSLKLADACALAPLDFYPAVSRFLREVRPAALILVETELWPHLIALSRTRGTRVAIVNGRISERSFPRYRLASPFLRPFLRRIERVLVQTEADARRFLALGCESAAVRVAGNMKFDNPPATADQARAQAFLKGLGWGQAPLLVAGSTHPGEEEQVFDAYLAARQAFPRLKLIVAPRHVERSAQTESLLRARGLAPALWSRGPQGGADALLLDALGVLAAFYPLAAVSFVGGSLVPVGGHNLLEPALAGSPVLFGPHVFDQAQAARALESAGCGLRVGDGGELAQRLKELLGDPPRARALGDLALRTAEGLNGAVGRTLEGLAPLLPGPSAQMV